MPSRSTSDALVQLIDVFLWSFCPSFVLFFLAMSYLRPELEDFYGAERFKQYAWPAMFLLAAFVGFAGVAGKLLWWWGQRE